MGRKKPASKSLCVIRSPAVCIANLFESAFSPKFPETVQFDKKISTGIKSSKRLIIIGRLVFTIEINRQILAIRLYR